MLSPIEKLPDVPLIHMMSYLNLKDRKNLRLTCQRFYELSYNLRLIKNDVLNLERIEDLATLPSTSRYVNLDLSNCGIIAEPKVAEYWKSHGRIVKSIELVGVEKNSAFALRHCPNVETIILIGLACRNCMKHERPELEDTPLNLSLKKLKRVELIHLANLDLSGVIETIFSDAPATVQFAIKLYFKITKKMCSKFIAFIEKHSNMLIELEVDESCTIRDDLLIKLLEAAGPKLTSFSIIGSEIGSSVIETIGKKLTNMRYLRFINFNDNMIDPAVVALPNLTELTTNCLEGNPSSLKKLQNMTSLSLSECRELPAEDLIAAFGQKKLPQLLCLDLGFIQSVDCNVLCKICPNLPNLQHLSLDCCPAVKGKGLDAVCRNNKKLKILSLRHCDSLESESLCQISFDQLLFLSVRPVPVTEHILESLLQNCPNLLQIGGNSHEDHEILRERNRLRPFAFSRDYKW